MRIPRLLFPQILILMLLFSNFFGFPSISIGSGQDNDWDITFENMIKSMENKFNVSITVDAEANDQNTDNQKNIQNNFENALKSASVEEALDIITAKTNLEYQKIRKDYYIIKVKGKTANLIPEKKSLYEGGEITIKGQVTQDRDGNTIPGVNVVIKNTSTGVVTDIDGNYEITVPSEATILIFSFVGFKTVEIPVQKQSIINVALKEDVFGLEEVVVSGVAAATPRKNLPVSVARVDSKELNKVPAISAASALGGKIAGVRMVQGYGLPGSGASIRLRGTTSLTGANSPLVILDGNILNTNLADINVDDIELVEVVQGAAASALYGSKAGNGVLVYKTKRGDKLDEGTTSVTFRSEVGFQELAKQIQTATHHPYELAEDWEDYDYTRYDGVLYNEEGIKIAGTRRLNNSDSTYADQPFKKLYNHQDRFFNKGMFQTYYFSMMGKSKKTNFMTSYERSQQEGILFSTKGYTRNNLKFNLDHHLNDKIKISSSNLLIKTFSDNPGNSWSAFKNLLFISPDVDLLAKNSDSTDYIITPDQWDKINENPLYPLAYRERTAERMSLIGNVRALYNMTDWLNFDIKYTYEYRNKYWNTLSRVGYLGNDGFYIGGSLYEEYYNEFSQNFQSTANLNKQFNNLTTKLKLSYLHEHTSWNDLWFSGTDFEVNNVPHANNFKPENTSTGSNGGKIAAINYFAIADIDYKDKYIFSTLYRRDGSSLFGEHSRWRDYYRVSGAYRLTEDFIIPGIDELKIRSSYGGSGQRPGYSDQYESIPISSGDILPPNTLGNYDLKPSKTTELEAGLNLEFLSRFMFEFVYSDAITEDVIELSPVASHFGFPWQYRNVGTLAAKSFEATLGSNIINNENVNWNINLVFDKVMQKITELDIPAYKTGPRSAFYIREGEVIGVMYGYQWLTSLDEIANQLPENTNLEDFELNNEGYVIPAGSQGSNNEIPIRLDADNDGNPDIVKIGDGNPDFNLSLSSTFSWKNLSAYTLLSYKYGGDVYNYTRQYMYRDLRAEEIDQSGKSPENKKSIYYYSAFYNNTEINSYFVEDGTFLKLREVAISYTLQQKHFNKLLKIDYIKSMRFSLQAHNLLTLTNYTGYDPEVASGDDLTNYPFDDFGYPNFRTYTFSLKINL